MGQRAALQIRLAPRGGPTEKGLALQATVQGTKFWPDDSLNGK
jgi:hypothetical protein